MSDNLSWYQRKLAGGLRQNDASQQPPAPPQAGHYPYPQPTLQQAAYAPQAPYAAPQYQQPRQDVQPESLADELAQQLGFEDRADFRTHTAPIIPEPIVHLCRYGEMFTDDSVIWQLRPMLYTFWN